MVKRSLYQCLNAKCPTEEGKTVIKCAAGVKLPSKASMIGLVRGTPLEFACCQKCKNYDEMGGPVEGSDRGWVKK